MRASVAMAVYFGGAYLQAQIDSILCQLREGDELIISLDCADTESEALLAPYLSNPLVKLTHAKQGGVVANFSHALSQCQNEIIFLADQDDVWCPKKVQMVLDVFEQEPNTLLVLHDAIVTDANLATVKQSFFADHGVCHGVFKNMLRNCYMGCCMAMRRELLQAILPLPVSIPMHDQWLGLWAEAVQGSHFIQEPLLLWRRHGANASATHHAPLFQMLKFRLSLLCAWQKTKKQRREFVKQWTYTKENKK